MADAAAATESIHGSEPTIDERHQPMTAKVLDAEILDDFLIRLLLHSFLADLRSIPAAARLPAAAARLLRAAATDPHTLLLPLARAAALLLCRGQTPAVRLLGMRVRGPRRRGGAEDAEDAAPPPSWARLGAYAVCAFVLPTAYEWFKRDWIQRRPRRLQTIMERRMALEERHRRERPPHQVDGQEEPAGALDPASLRSFDSQSHPEIKALERRERLGSLLLRLMDGLLPAVQLSVLLTCWAGRSSVPSAAMALAGLRYDNAPPSAPAARLSVDYAHRRWLCQEAARTARLLWIGLTMTDTWRPLIVEPWRDWRARLVAFWRWRLQQRCGTSLGHGSDGPVPDGQATTKRSLECLLCHTMPVVVPVEADCSCRGRYCYTCLYQYSRRNPRRTESDIVQTPCVQCGGSIKVARYL